MSYQVKDKVNITCKRQKTNTYTSIVTRLTRWVVFLEGPDPQRKDLKFNRETGKSIPESTCSIIPDRACKACHNWDMSEQRVVFRRIDRYERKRVITYGYECKSCGYLNSDRKGNLDKLGRLSEGKDLA